MATPDIEILVGVLGGASISDGSGKEIKDTLLKIAEKINSSSAPEIKIGVDKQYLKDAIQKTLDELPAFKIKTKQGNTHGVPDSRKWNNQQGYYSRDIKSMDAGLKPIIAKLVEIKKVEKDLFKFEGDIENLDIVNAKLAVLRKEYEELLNVFLYNHGAKFNFFDTKSLDEFIAKEAKAVIAQENVNKAQLDAQRKRQKDQDDLEKARIAEIESARAAASKRKIAAQKEEEAATNGILDDLIDNELQIGNIKLQLLNPKNKEEAEALSAILDELIQKKLKLTQDYKTRMGDTVSTSEIMGRVAEDARVQSARRTYKIRSARADGADRATRESEQKRSSDAEAARKAEKASQKQAADEKKRAAQIASERERAAKRAEASENNYAKSVEDSFSKIAATAKEINKVKIDLVNATDEEEVAQLEARLKSLQKTQAKNVASHKGLTGKTTAEIIKEANAVDTVKRSRQELNKANKIFASDKDSELSDLATAQANLIRDQAAIFGKIGQVKEDLEVRVADETKRYNADVTAYAKKYGMTEEEVQAQVDGFRRVVSARKALEDATSKNAAQFSEESIRYQKLKVRVDEYAEEIKTLIGYYPELAAKMSDFQDKVNQGEGAFSGGIAEAEVAFFNLRNEFQKAGVEVETLGQKIVRVFKDKFGYAVLAAAADQARRAIRQIYDNVVELDTAMTELKKVTNETSAAYEQFLDGAASRARNLGATLADTVSATADFARLGYNLDEASELADAALVYKNVGDGISDISVASESIISTMQGFGIEASRAMSIVDKFNITGNRFAISSAGVGEALQRSAAAMNAAGNDIDETIALVTAANTVLQNPDVVGTTMKTLSMYLRAAKTDLEDAGESTEGMAGSVSELRNEILNLTGQKVDIQADDSTFKNTYQILKELSKEWNNLNDISKANVLELIAGKRNANAAAAILENFDIAERALATSQDAAGSALAENEKYLDSINGKIAKMQASYQKVSDKILDSGVVKVFYDIVTWLIDALGVLIEVGDGAIVKLLALSAAIISISTALKLIQASATAGVLSNLVKAFGAVKSALAGLLGVASLSNPAFLGIAAAISVVALGAMKLYDVYKELNPTAEDLAEKAQNSAAELESVTTELENIELRLKELKELKEQGALSLTEAEELERLEKENAQLAIRKQILEDIASEDAEKAEKEKVRELNISDRTFVGSASGNFWDSITQVTKPKRMQMYIDRINKMNDDIAAKESELSGMKETDAGYHTKSVVLQNLRRDRDDVLSDAKTFYSDLDAEMSTISGHTEEGQKMVDMWTDMTIAFSKFNGTFDAGTTAKAIFGKFDHAELKGDLDALSTSGHLTGESLYQMYRRGDAAASAFIADLKEGGVISTATAETLQLVIDALYGVQEASDSGAESFSLNIDGVKKLAEQYELLAKAKKEYSEDGGVSIATLESISEKFGEVGREQAELYAHGLISASELFSVLKTKYDEDVDNYQDSVRAKMYASPEFYQSLTDNQKTLIDDLAKSYDTDLENFTTIEKAKLAIQSSIISDLAKNYGIYAGASMDLLVSRQKHLTAALASGITGDGATRVRNELSAVTETINELNKLDSRLNEIVGGAVTDKWNPSDYADKGTSSSTDKFKQALEKQAKILQHHREMDKITAEQYYDGLEEILAQYQTNAVKYAEEIADLEQQIFNGRRELFADLTADRQYHADRMIMAGDYEQARAINQAILEDTKKQIDAAIEYGLDENSDYVQELRKQAADAGKALLDAITESFDQFMSYADDFNIWKDLDFTKLEYLEKLLNDIDALYLKGAISWKEYVEAHNNVAKQMYDAQKDSIETIIDMTMEMIEQEAEDKVDALEKQKDAYQDIIDLKKKELNIGKEQDNHDREVEEKIKETAKLQSRISQLSLDDSREAQAEKAALEEELHEKQKELADLQNEYVLDQTLETLDESAEAFEKSKDKEIEAAEDAVDTWVERYNIAIDRIDNDWENLYEDLEDWMAIHRDSIDGPDSLKTSWENVIALKDKYANMSIEDIYDQMGANIALNPGAPDDPEAKAILEKMKQNSITAKQEGTSMVNGVNLHQKNKDLANDYYELTGQKLYYNNGWRYDNENGDLVYDVSGVKRNPTTGGGNASGGTAAGSKSEYGDKYLATVAKFDEPPSGVIAKGSTNTKGVKWIQYFLQQTGHFKNSVDGVFWDKLQDALEEFQDENDIPADGKYGPQTLAKMKKYHTGGVVDGTGAINDHEVLALLEKGELVLDDKKKSNLKLMFAKIGNMIEWASAASAIANVRNPAPGKASSSGDTWAPNFEVTIHHNGNMTDADAKRYGRQIGNEALEQLRIAFNKRGK